MSLGIDTAWLAPYTVSPDAARPLRLINLNTLVQSRFFHSSCRLGTTALQAQWEAVAPSSLQGGFVPMPNRVDTPYARGGLCP